MTQTDRIGEAGGAPLVLNLTLKALRGQFGSELLAGISLVTPVLLGEYLAASLERYSKHPLAKPILQVAERLQVSLLDATELGELPGKGLERTVDGVHVRITDAPTVTS